MALPPFSKVALKVDLREDGLQKGDVATIVDYLPGKDCEHGYALEVFNAVGDTIAVVMVAQSAVEPLTADQVLSVRPLVRTP